MNDFEIIDPRFASYVMGNASVEKIATGFRWVEGPVWFGDAGCLLFSDIPNNRIMRWIDGVGISVYREPSNFSNGHTRDLEGRLVSCEHGERRVTRTEHDGRITVLAESYQGKRLNSPNDVVVKSDGSVWFTDPHYGIVTDYEGYRAEQELPCQVYRIDPESGALDVVLKSFDCPNGLCFSPDESRLYVAETGKLFDAEADRCIRAFDVADNGRDLKDGGLFHRVDAGCADGFRCDRDGNVWTSAGDGVHCLSPEGELLGKILIPETVSNVCFGGRAKARLFMTATTSVYSLFLNRNGVQHP
ncbi:MAG: SMP-30/gluconolactonase/LRE family protein [Geminicoccaceae bacterium]